MFNERKKETNVVLEIEHENSRLLYYEDRSFWGRRVAPLHDASPKKLRSLS